MATVFDTFEESDFAETERMAKWTLCSQKTLH